ncbi:DDHD domain-containing protein [Gorgonomyces haynaldii]|nr:DDHD domain-containing protein [Gorgonomyces haynaldii]
MDQRQIEPRWFYAKDAPKRDTTPYKKQDRLVKTPTIWEPFSDEDSERIEAKSHEGNVPVLEDYLYEVNVQKLEVGPIYWDGPFYEVRRGIWFEFTGPSGSPWVPCDENLTKQLEDGYRKFMPLDKQSPGNQVTKSMSSSLDTISSSTPAIDKRWALFGRFINNSVVYTDHCTAYLQSDHIGGQISRLVSSGTKLIRGWGEVEKLANRRRTEKKDGQVSRENSTKEPSIGQKLAENLDGSNIVLDTGVFRTCLKTSAEQLKTILPPAQGDKIPKYGGIQVLPVQWRHQVRFATTRTESESEDIPVLSDIALEGIPGIRMLVSDVILDECNRIYRLWKERNPDFNGTVSLYGHSLGSVLSMDVLSSDPVRMSPQNPKMEKQASTVDLTDLLTTGSASRFVKGLMGTMENVSFEPLCFPVQTLFAVGSPIGIFLLLEGNRLRAYEEVDGVPVEEKHVTRPKTKQIYNIFHPYDPVAFRMEPLVTPSMKQSALTDLSDMSTNIVNKGFNLIESVRSSIVTTTSDAVTGAGLFFTNTPERKTSDVSLKQIEQKPNLVQEDDIKKLNDTGRIDYSLQEGVLENPYLSSLAIVLV